ncbi:hypothetical protein F5Y08DRAFT_343830 [Xylaria arbuscula]|nr:hypothetical protein F5Y08DRAFT_343830 [Xylaria arbuscula]
MSFTNLGSLPTDFAIAPTCSAALNQVYKIYTSSEFYLLQGPVEQTTCFPSSFAGRSTQYYSPAQCPTGYTSACQTYTSTGNVQETIVGCCPTQESFACQSTLSHNWEFRLGCILPQDTATTTVWTVTQVSDGQTARTTYTDAVGGINAYQVQVGHSTDSKTTKTTTTKKTTANGVSHPTTTKHSSSSSSSSSGKHGKHKSSSGGISGGAIAGIVIGAVAVLSAAVAGICLKGRKGSKEREGDGEEGEQEGLARDGRSSIDEVKDGVGAGGGGTGSEAVAVAGKTDYNNNDDDAQRRRDSSSRDSITGTPPPRRSVDREETVGMPDNFQPGYQRPGEGGGSNMPDNFQPGYR